MLRQNSLFFNSVRSLLTVPFQSSAWSLTEKTIRSCLSECPTNVFSVLCHADDEFETTQSWVVHFDQLATRSHVCLRFATPAAFVAPTVLALSDSACNRPVKAAIPGGPRPCPLRPWSPPVPSRRAIAPLFS